MGDLTVAPRCLTRPFPGRVPALVTNTLPADVEHPWRGVRFAARELSLQQPLELEHGIEGKNPRPLVLRTRPLQSNDAARPVDVLAPPKPERLADPPARAPEERCDGAQVHRQRVSKSRVLGGLPEPLPRVVGLGGPDLRLGRQTARLYREVEHPA